MNERILITGEPGADTTNYSINAILNMFELNDENSCMVIAPESDYLETLKFELLKINHLPALFSNRFKTFGSFISSINPEIKLIPVGLKQLLIKDILQNPVHGLKSFSHMPGFRKRIEKLFKEFLAHEPDLRELLLNTLENEFPHGWAGHFLVKNTISAFRAFTRILDKRGLDTKESALHKVSLQMLNTDSNQTLLITGFLNFTRSELNLVRTLSETSKNIYIIMRVDSNLETLNETTSTLINYGFTVNNLPNDSIPHNISENIELPSIYDEVEYITQRVAQFIDDGYNPEEIILIHPQPIKTLRYFETAFKRLSIPLKNSLPKPLKTISPVRELISILELLNGNLDDAKSLISSQFLRSIPDLARNLDNKILNMLTNGDDVEKPHEISSVEWNKFNDYISKIKEITSFQNFSSFIQSLKTEFVIDPHSISDEIGDLAGTSWYTFFHKILPGLADYSIHSDPKHNSDSSFSSLFYDLKDQIENTSIRSRNRRRSAVEIMSIESAIHRKPRIAILSGMNELMFPLNTSKDPLLGDNIRNTLKSRGFDFRVTKDTHNEDIFLLDHLLHIKCEKFIITAPVNDQKGEPVNISLPLQARYPSTWKKPEKSLNSVFTFDDLLIKCSEFYSCYSTDSETKEVKSELEQFYPRGNRSMTSNVILDENIEQRFIDDFTEFKKPYSASALNNYARCPFIYLASNMLGLPGSETSLEKILTPLVKGNLIHKYLSKQICPNPEETSIRELLSELNIDPGDFDFIEERTFESFSSVTENFIENELVRMHDKERVLIAAEKPFGMKGGPEVLVKIQNSQRFLRGIIDRIDQNPDGSVTIIDYKTGSSNIKAIFNEALVFQLPIYLIAIESMAQKASAVEIVKISRKKHDFISEVPSQVEGLSRIANAIERIEAGFFPVQPGESAFCGWNKCGYYHLCRINQ